MNIANPVTLPLSGYAAQHVSLAVAGAVATITLNRPERKNPLTFESYAELGNIFRARRPRQKRQGDRDHRRRRQFLFRRRRVRDHQAAHRDGHQRTCSISRA